MADYKIHYPVMLNEVLENLDVANGKIYVDATFGNGGYSEAILNKADCKVIALDRDANVLARAKEMKQIYGNRFEFRQGCFGNFDTLVSENIDGAVFDIGVSSMQLDQAERGFPQLILRPDFAVHEAKKRVFVLFGDRGHDFLVV